MKNTFAVCCPPPPKNEGKKLKVQDADRELAAFASALANPARVRIVRQMIKDKGCLCRDLVVELHLAQATVSQHLKVLRTAGLITGSTQGSATCYCLRPGVLDKFQSLLAGMA